MLSQTKQTNKQTQFLECRDLHSSRYKYSNTLATLTLIILFVANVEIFKKVFFFFFFLQRKEICERKYVYIYNIVFPTEIFKFD
jgi:hypothetical protein